MRRDFKIIRYLPINIRNRSKDMFRCEWCENFYDKSECYENPVDDCSLICFDCLADYEEENKE